MPREPQGAAIRIPGAAEAALPLPQLLSPRTLGGNGPWLQPSSSAAGTSQTVLAVLGHRDQPGRADKHSARNRGPSLVPHTRPADARSWPAWAEPPAGEGAHPGGGSGRELKGSRGRPTPPRPGSLKRREHESPACGLCSSSDRSLRKPDLPRPSLADAQPECHAEGTVGSSQRDPAFLLTSASGSASRPRKLVIGRQWL